MRRRRSRVSTVPTASPNPRPRSDFSIFIEQFQSLPVALLGGASVLSAATGGLVDAAVILGVVGINTIVGYFTESQSEHIIQSPAAGGGENKTARGAAQRTAAAGGSRRHCAGGCADSGDRQRRRCPMVA